jgi:L-ascorbate metabolism protein UlaG (beta-lactamase superfamily)
MSMTKKIFIGLSGLTVLVVMGFFLSTPSSEVVSEPTPEFLVAPVEHASFGLTFAGMNILNDPVGDVQQYAGMGIPEVIFISDVHGDHFDIDTLAGVVAASTTIIAPEVVYDQLPVFLKDKTVVMANGDSHTIGALNFAALPMYNLPMEGENYRHVKGVGNGYLLESAGTRIYIAGDTEDTPEMRTLEDIDVAFIPMNLPYTMDVDTAASGVLAFAPDVVYPYHYRGTDGLADIGEFARLVAQENPEIEVRILDWYSE